MKSIILLVLLSGLVYSRVLKTEDQKQSSRTDEVTIGDVILTKEQYEFLFGGGSRNGVPSPVRRWPNKELSYIFDLSMPDSRITEIEEVISRFNSEMNGCFQIVPRISAIQKDWFVKISYGPGCSSRLGRSPYYKGIGQPLKLAPGCFRDGSPTENSILHEFIHAIGFFHEQARTDRNDYVRVFLENVESGAEGQFDIAEGSDDFGTPYDGLSVMHYSRWAFSKNDKDTIQALESSDFTSDDLGQRVWMTSNDALKIRKMYNCTVDGSTTATTTPFPPTTTKSPTCAIPLYYNDTWCDDENNNAACNWDGGDCCGSQCKIGVCNCLDPNFGGITTPSPPTTTTTKKTTTMTTTKAPAPPSSCAEPDYKSDGECDDENNTVGCDWDGGDCCPATNPNPNWDVVCQECQCLDPMGVPMGL